jgi:hypothetical protein
LSSGYRFPKGGSTRNGQGIIGALVLVGNSAFEAPAKGAVI